MLRSPNSFLMCLSMTVTSKSEFFMHLNKRLGQDYQDGAHLFFPFLGYRFVGRHLSDVKSLRR